MHRQIRNFVTAVCVGVLCTGTVLPPGADARDLRESKVFRQFLQKPRSEFAKLVCLMNYYRTEDFIIRFDGFDYTPAYAFPYAKSWLFTHYNKEKAEEWVKKNCYVSPYGRNIIYVKFPGGDYEIARDMILRDLAGLETAIADHEAGSMS
ncbi:MAG: hypothetical protein BWY42_00633 [Candidatus Omnitrophica bacterium ADurb.Bin277]|nr:MAG: hypothetical protein BWY42_00633 [Candidatus Omnitrophica bacterium ADurb.Bin277]